jgi:hypothetical protein
VLEIWVVDHRRLEGLDRVADVATRVVVPRIKRISRSSHANLLRQGSFDVHFTYPISSPKSVFKIQTQVAADLGSGAMLTVR